MFKRHYLIYLSTLFIGCNNQKPDTAVNDFIKNTQPVKIKLIKNLGFVTMRVPNTYNTLLTWTSLSDCTECGTVKYRLQPKDLPIAKESGFIPFPHPPKDSINQLTIYHDDFLYPNAIISNSVDRITKLHKASKRAFIEKMRLKTDGQIKRHIPWDSVENINGRFFSIIETNEFDSTRNQYIKTLFGETSISKTSIKFRYELLTMNNDSTTIHFFENARNLIRTIRIIESK
ncbi:hypothetical protein H8B15_07780 [Hymenobacter sp. BT507]|uniref:Lipoprotein n=1 Tax=Hymenobacter citatus TaxID=2763506 RepID=A0ABR7MIP2_9BACT|nr:hypothetical protein [Hymenobacter citatus]MBC6610818.1 hypothetical protein [Hymenobacter citatus]